MADQATTEAAKPPETTPEAKPEAEQKQDKTFTQDELNQKIGERLAREREKYEGFDGFKAKAEKFDEIEEAQRSETEKLAKERDGLKERVTPLESENLRLRVALDKKLPAQLIDRLKGGTREEMETDADELLKLVAAKEETPTDFDGGARTTPTEKKKPEEAHNDFLGALLEGKEPPT